MPAALAAVPMRSQALPAPSDHRFLGMRSGLPHVTLWPLASLLLVSRVTVRMMSRRSDSIVLQPLFQLLLQF